MKVNVKILKLNQKMQMKFDLDDHPIFLYLYTDI